MFTTTTTHLTVLALLSAATVYCFYKSHRLRRLKVSSPSSNPNHSIATRRGKLFFISQTGTSKTLAQRLFGLLISNNIPFDLVDPNNYEPEDLHTETLVLIIASTWEDGNPPSNGVFLSKWLSESAEDFRVGSLLLNKCKFAVFGVGSRAYGDSFNAVGRGFSRKMRSLGGVEILPLREGDVDEGDIDKEFGVWSEEVIRVLKMGELRGNGSAFTGENGGELMNGSDYDEDDDDDYEDEGNGLESDIIDLEDIAGKSLSKKDMGLITNNGKKNGEKVMVTPVIRASLTKQGYKIIGSHSGVKICRWTKSQLRGRGGCYKHSFYGIESHSKIIVIKSERLERLGSNLKPGDGMPAGVTAERLSEGLLPRHCALSLVGEPIMYPEINSLIDELHKRRISTFLVTNAQFPDKIVSLKPITQLYVSVDAATKDSMKAIDRPLFGDFWERFVDSLKALKDKQQRTVYRLTLVKGWNTEDVDAYSNLFSIGNPDFVEIKGVTYCGTSATSKLTMENVPWHADVKAFSEALAEKSHGQYEVACEHVHSCCVLLAKVDKFKINGQWHTWIDYEKFHDLVSSGKPFGSNDYMALTPSWAVYGANEGGFDPEQARYKKERNHKSSR
ncbi:hypothetical protein R6Q59_025256 [Mikania micrantha]